MAKESITALRRGTPIQDSIMNNIVKFNEMPWHDSILLKLEVDRNKPGEIDTVKVLIKWPNGKDEYLIFKECYFFEALMNFGVVAEESILSASCSNDDEKIAEIQRQWATLGVTLNDLLCYKISTNSTNSTLKIYALSGYSITE